MIGLLRSRWVLLGFLAGVSAHAECVEPNAGSVAGAVLGCASSSPPCYMVIAPAPAVVVGVDLVEGTQLAAAALLWVTLSRGQPPVVAPT